LVNAIRIARIPRAWFGSAVLACGGWLFALAALAQPSQRVTTYEYHDNTQSWQLGQVQRITVNGIESERTSFNAQALPEQRFVFGERVSTTTYHRDGNVASVTDGGGQVSSVTDEVGATTCYAYGAMGRLVRITPAAELKATCAQWRDSFGRCRFAKRFISSKTDAL
jgi:YD repeat-containing protein